MGETLAIALRLLERHPALARLRVRARLPSALPAVQIDQGSLQQVVMALVMNASAAMPAGGTLGVAAARKGRLLHLDVTDTGAPLPEAERAHVFEPYSTADAQRGQTSGSPSPGACSAAAGAI